MTYTVSGGALNSAQPAQPIGAFQQDQTSQSSVCRHFWSTMGRCCRHSRRALRLVLHYILHFLILHEHVLTDGVRCNYTLSCDAAILYALTELSLPEDVNIFYAVDLRNSAPLKLAVRRKADMWHLKSRQDSKSCSWCMVCYLLSVLLNLAGPFWTQLMFIFLSDCS